MCEQCGTEMLCVYSETKNDTHLYIGIVRKEWGTFEPGDIMVGDSQTPDVHFDDDLFDMDEWMLIDRDPDKWEAIQKEHGDDHLASDRFMFKRDEPFWYNVEGFHWSCFATAAIRLDRHFGPQPDDFGAWHAWPIVSVAEIFKERGIPLDKKGRAEWATRFDESVDYVSFTGMSEDGKRVYEIKQHVFDYEDEKWETKTFEWVEGNLAVFR